MDTTELIQRVRRVELKTRGLSDRIFSGEYHSAFKGRGMAFSENREYQHGDEIRQLMPLEHLRESLEVDE